MPAGATRVLRASCHAGSVSTCCAVASWPPGLIEVYRLATVRHMAWQRRRAAARCRLAVAGHVDTLAVLLVRVDRPNLSLLRAADFLGCLEYTLEEGPRWDWFGDDTIRATAWISGITGIAFIWRSLTHAQPVVDLRALKSRNFSLGCFFSFVTGIGIFATIYLTPIFLARVRGFSALQIGIAIFSTGVFRCRPFRSTLSAPDLSIYAGC
jgi:hypothetical protein